MNSGIDFINNLQERRSRYANPEQAENQYQAVLQLSSGIYAEEDRFVYELLQNADDAKEDGTHLDISIILKDGYFVFAHNGRPFNERDIEGICNIGNGGKKLDKGKIGYKGIGFKSVFHHSNCVTIICPEYQFRFDEQHWDGFWDTNWDESFRSSEPSKYHLPWQLIPIYTPSVPIALPEGCPDNVQIFIKARDITTLSQKVSHLMSDPNLLLFLKNNSISIKFHNNDQPPYLIAKEEKNGHIILTSDKQTVGEWLMLTPPPMRIPEDVQKKIATDFNTPDKMKRASEVEISLALSVSDGKNIRVDNALTYTYLPTSEQLGFPFIINSNFILDAGRQHLNKDSVWNKYILSLIPKTLFTSLKDNDAAIINNYPDSWYSILPAQSKEGILFTDYNKEMSMAIEKEPIVPALNGGLLIVRNTIIDETGLANILGKEQIVDYVCKRDNVHLDTNALAPVDYLCAFKPYGIHVFCFSDLSHLFCESNYSIPVDTEGNLAFIHGMYAFADKLNKDQKSLFNEIMRSIPFVRNSSGSLSRPDNLYVPSGDSSLAQGVQLICPSIRCSTSSKEDSWLGTLGIGKIGDDRFIENHILKKPSFVNVMNAIAVGRLLFDAYYRGVLKKHKDAVKELKFLTTRNTLVDLQSIYLSSAYAPGFDFQPYSTRDCFLSELYIENGNHERWKVFLEDMGCARFVGIETIMVSEEEYNAIDPIATQLVRSQVSEEYYDSPTSGRWKYVYDSYSVQYIPLWLARSNNYDLLTKVFGTIFNTQWQQPYERVESYTGCIYRPLNLSNYLNGVSFLERAFVQWQMFPCTDGKLHRLQEIFANKKDIIKIGGKYLPIFAFEDVDLSWDRVLHFKTVLDLQDYLSILSAVSQDPDSNNMERVSDIYILLADWLYDKRINSEVISEWGKNNRILATDGSYYYPCSLSVTQIKGITDIEKEAYIGQKLDHKLSCLLETLGVSIITPDKCLLHVELETNEVDQVIKNLLLSKIPAITILSDDSLSYQTRREAIISVLEKTCFKKCVNIELEYGASKRKVSKSSYFKDYTFYYVTPFRVSILNEMMTPLCEMLSLEGKEKELFLVLLENSSGVKSYLENLGYNVTFLEMVECTQAGDDMTFNPMLDGAFGEEEQNRITGFMGEIIVYEYLKSLGYEPICKSITTSEQFERMIQYNGKNYRCIRNYDRYDISFLRNGQQVFIEVKSTVKSIGELENMPISSREFSMINDGCEYYIARVFNADSNSPDIYFLKGEKKL